MLSIGKLGTGQENYYLDNVAEGAEEYYSGEGEVAGQWMGDAAAELGLSGEVGADQLTAMLTGRNPVTGEPLGLRAVGGRGPVPGFDLTFSAPKSVSLLWGLGGPVAGVETNAAHTAAVSAALDYLQQEACWTRRGAGGAEFVKGNGFLAAAFQHRSSRNGDPQLHTHVLIANATKGPEGKWSRLYHPAIYEHAQTASYIYEAQLRHELTCRLGVGWKEVRRGIAEIEGFADEHLRAFSTRRAEILEAAGPDASARAMGVAALATRKAKEQGVSREELHERWRARAEEIGLDRETISRTFDREARFRGELAESRAVSHAEIGEAVTAHASHFERRDAIRAVADLQRAGAPAEEVLRMADEFLTSEEVLRISTTPRADRYTTQRIWELEREALATVEQMKAEPRGVAGELIAHRVIAARPTLKDDQREMVWRLLTDPEGIAVVVGEAGTGKSFATVAAAEGWTQAGYFVRAATPTWRAASVLRAEGLEASAIARLLIDIERGEVDLWQTVLVIDEAGMVGSNDMAKLIAHAEAAEAKLVLIGDPEQLGAIEAGGLFAAIAERGDPVHLHEVIRHNHELDRIAAKHLREGEGRQALHLYRTEDRVIVAPNAEARREAMVGDWWRSFAEGEEAVMVAKRNAEVTRLNAMAREQMKVEGRLGEQELIVGEVPFAAGEQVIIRVNDHAARIYNRERWRIAEVDEQRGRIVLEGIDQARTVEVGADYLARRTPHGDAPALQHAYAVTTYCAQGSTIDRAFVMADPSMDKQELYVAASRTREQTHLYATPEIQAARSEYAPAQSERDPVIHLAEASERDRAQLAAHEVARFEELRGLPVDTLKERHRELRAPAQSEHYAEEANAKTEEWVPQAEEALRKALVRLEQVKALPRRERKEKLSEAEFGVTVSRRNYQTAVERQRDAVPPGVEARRERALVGRAIAEREAEERSAIAARPPAYVLAELGDRPIDLAKGKAWDRGAEAIEGYRRSHEIADPLSALGDWPESGSERSARRRAEESLQHVQRRLGLEAELARSQERSIENDRGFGIGL